MRTRKAVRKERELEKSRRESVEALRRMPSPASASDASGTEASRTQHIAELRGVSVARARSEALVAYELILVQTEKSNAPLTGEQFTFEFTAGGQIWTAVISGMPLGQRKEKLA